jgi:hypothetical protein
MAGIKWWTDERVAFLRRLAAKGKSARRIAAAVSRRWKRRVSAKAVRDVAGSRGIRLLARGGPPKGNQNWKGGG